jgi:hypothetical protein
MEIRSVEDRVEYHSFRCEKGLEKESKELRLFLTTPGNGLEEKSMLRVARIGIFRKQLFTALVNDSKCFLKAPRHPKVRTTDKLSFSRLGPGVARYSRRVTVAGLRLQLLDV